MVSHQQSSHKEYEEPEGLDLKHEDLELKEYPIDSLLIRNETRTVFEVIRRIKKNDYILDPDFQRDFVWDKKKQSRLIESMLMRIPLPVFYLAETDDGKIVVVDGLQRLSTFHSYLNNDFALKGLKSTNPKLEGKKFIDLIPKLKNRLEDTQLILYLIDSKVPERARLDIFERVNSGGEPLTRQQMRNALNMGKATRWLKEQAKSRSFLEATAGSLNSKTMRDRELINRFCGFYLLGINHYKGDMDDFLATTLKQMNKMTDEELEELGRKFQKSMENNYKVFKQHAFRKHTNNSQKRSVINAALFDVFSVVMTKFDVIDDKVNKIQQQFFNLMEDDVFISAITFGTNETIKVKDRFRIAKKAFEEL